MKNGPVIDRLTVSDYDVETHKNVEVTACKVMFYANGQIKLELEDWPFTGMDRFKVLKVYKDRLVLVATDDNYGGVVKQRNNAFGANAHAFITIGSQKYFGCNTSYAVEGDEKYSADNRNVPLDAAYCPLYVVERPEAINGITVKDVVVVFSDRLRDILEDTASNTARDYADSPDISNEKMPRLIQSPVTSTASSPMVIDRQVLREFMDKTPNYIMVKNVLEECEKH